jgi:hypothetical protein
MTGSGAVANEFLQSMTIQNKRVLRKDPARGAIVSTRCAIAATANAPVPS